MSTGIVVETREEKNRLVKILNGFKVVYFYGESKTGKSFIRQKFRNEFPDCKTISCELSAMNPIDEIKRMKTIFNKILFGKRMIDENTKIFIEGTEYCDDVIKNYPDCLLVEFKNSELIPKSIIVETREEKENLVDILNEFKVVYFHGGLGTGKSFIQRKFENKFPDCKTISCELPVLNQIDEIQRIKDMFKQFLFGKRMVDENIKIFFQGNEYCDDVVKNYQDCLLVEFKNSESVELIESPDKKRKIN
jgi:hypothetical protein